MTFDSPWFLLLGALAAAALFWPRHGAWSRWREARRLAERARQEDALKHILKCEANGETATVLSVAGALRLRDGAAAALLRELEARGLVSFEEGRLRLQPPGRELGLHVVRAHRLWESYLAEQTGVAEARWHRLAERQEHLLSPQQAQALAARLGHPLHDPHGDVIPERGERLAADTGQSLNTVPPGRAFTIVHIEDEPEVVYARLLRLGLRPGMRAYVVEKAPEGIVLWAEGREFSLVPSMANQLSVVELPSVTPADLRAEGYLHELPPGVRARVLGLIPACRGPERRRLLDLGFVAGSEVEASLVSPTGDPTAYQVRGALVALRREQARVVRVARLAPEEAAA
ncbi:MAG: DtxR family transcriptional regulator [Verrucomicrobia bacterium]|nr:DtxR family transcriptional regulator [Verrucomicrobiota bacterium]